jgi:tRNA G18 (ribose-2'-O)-methylase SpoU
VVLSKFCANSQSNYLLDCDFWVQFNTRFDSQFLGFLCRSIMAPRDAGNLTTAGNREAGRPLESAERPAAHRFEELGLELLLYELQSPINLGIILRVAETYQFTVSVFGSNRVFDDSAAFSTVKDFSCGAWSRRGVNRLDRESLACRLGDGRRLIATSISPAAQSLSEFRFQPSDVVALGNEYDGLPDELLAAADVHLHVPTPAVWTPKERSHSPIDPHRAAPVARDGQPSLNVAVTAGILCYAAYEKWHTQR